MYVTYTSTYQSRKKILTMLKIMPLQADDDKDPTSELGTNFDSLDARTARENKEKEQKVDRRELSKFMQERYLLIFR